MCENDEEKLRNAV